MKSERSCAHSRGRGGGKEQSTNGSMKNLIKADDAAGIFIFCREKWKSGQVAQADFILNVAIASKAFGNGVGRQSGGRGRGSRIIITYTLVRTLT